MLSYQLLICLTLQVCGNERAHVHSRDFNVSVVGSLLILETCVAQVVHVQFIVITGASFFDMVKRVINIFLSCHCIM